MAINETLKFSWGHIIAFVALIFISYVSFMGITYLTDGDFIIAGIGVAIVNLILALFFIVPQVLKGTDVKFSRKIIFERILFFAAPVFFIVTMIPYSHFWTVFDNRSEVEQTFSESIKTTKGMFDSYEVYSYIRLKEYEKQMVANQVSEEHINNALEALELQLIGENYTTLKESAYEWVDNASGATVWNVFMIGNIDKIEDALDGWNRSLTDFSSKVMFDEPANVEPFTSKDQSVVNAKESMDSLRAIYTDMGAPTLLAIGVAILLYLMLLFPYIIQGRNTKSTYRLIGSENSKSNTRSTTTSYSSDAESKDDMVFNMGETKPSKRDDYGSFTL